MMAGFRNHHLHADVQDKKEIRYTHLRYLLILSNYYQHLDDSMAIRALVGLTNKICQTFRGYCDAIANNL